VFASCDNGGGEEPKYIDGTTIEVTGAQGTDIANINGAWSAMTDVEQAAFKLKVTRIDIKPSGAPFNFTNRVLSFETGRALTWIRYIFLEVGNGSITKAHDNGERLTSYSALS
jgi:hypothetical protein